MGLVSGGGAGGLSERETPRRIPGHEQYKQHPCNRSAAHETVDHSADEYVRGDVHVNFAESYFSLLKRGVIGIFHHISAKHMHRYLAEFDHRWNHRDITDGERVLDTLRNLVSERLYYNMPIEAKNATAMFAG